METTKRVLKELCVAKKLRKRLSGDEEKPRLDKVCQLMRCTLKICKLHA